MGISIRAHLNDDPMPYELRKCDGKSLADYYLAAMSEGMDAASLFGSMVEGFTESSRKVIHHDFRPKTENKQKTTNEELTRLLSGLTPYIENPDDGPKEITNLDKFEAAILAVRTAIHDYKGRLINFMGKDITQYRDGALDDCDDLITAIQICRTEKKRLRVLID